MHDDDLVYVNRIQRLGQHGLTDPCFRAMGVILTSPFPPKRITVVSSDKNSGSDAVLFLVWDWFSPGTTIVPDGFGTHSGEGGRGLSVVLGLIRYFEIPLFHAWLPDRESFRTLATGTMTEEIFDTIQEGTKPYDWGYHPVADVRKVKGKSTLEITLRGRVERTFP